MVFRVTRSRTSTTAVVRGQARLGTCLVSSGVRCYVEPSPAGGYFVRLRGEAAPLSRHDTEEEAEAHRLAYERGAATPAPGEIVDLPDG